MLCLLFALLFSACQGRSEFSARTVSNIGVYQGLFESNVSIVQPILGAPARLEAGDDLGIRVVLHGQVEGDWLAAISRYARVYDLPVAEVVPLNDSWLLYAPIPPDVAPGLYDLTVRKGTTVDLERHAVSIGHDDELITFIHITDVHVDRPEPDGLGSIMHTVDVINLLRPDLVVVTGDFQDPGYAPQMKEFATRILWNLDVPVYITPGNHEFKEDTIWYYEYLNPYPDYAFDFGPARFISLNQFQTYPFYNEQIDFLDSELARAGTGPTTILLHDPSSFRSYSRGNFTLMLAGHTHDNDAVDIGLSLQLGYSALPNPPPSGPLLLVTETARKAIRIITFEGTHILNCSCDPNKLKTAVPVANLVMRINPQEGPSNYQNLEIRNNLQIAIQNASWTFNLSNPGPGWAAVLVGAELEEQGSSGQRSLYRVRFDLAEMNLTSVECVNIVPTNEQSRKLLREKIDQRVQDLEAMCSIIRNHGADPRVFEQHLGEGLAAARLASEANDWTEAAVEFARADAKCGLLADVASKLSEASSKLAEKETGGVLVYPVRAWLGDAIQALRSEDCELAGEYLRRILALGEEEWLLADMIGRAHVALVLGNASGQDVREPKAELQSVVALFHDGKYLLSRQGLNRIYATWPQFFAVPESFAAGFQASLLALAFYLGKRRTARQSPCRSAGTGNVSPLALGVRMSSRFPAHPGGIVQPLESRMPSGTDEQERVPIAALDCLTTNHSDHFMVVGLRA